MPICLTFDTERNDYESVAHPDQEAYKEKSFSMLEDAIPKLMDISDDYKIPYTFFICGEVANNCSHLFKNMGRHEIGVHTHPFTHMSIFKGKTPNDREMDLLAQYSFEDQYKMINEDLKLIQENLNINPTIFRAGKHSANEITFKVLDELNFKIDCSMHPPFQLVGWRPFRIPKTTIWEIPTYSDVSPEIYPSVNLLFKFSSFARPLFNGIYVGLIHPMILGNPELNSKALFENYIKLIESLANNGFEFMTIDDAFNSSGKSTTICNSIGNALGMALKPMRHLIAKKGIKSILSKEE